MIFQNAELKAALNGAQHEISKLTGELDDRKNAKLPRDGQNFSEENSTISLNASVIDKVKV